MVDGANITLILGLNYNEIAGYWVMSIADSRNNPLVASIPLLCGGYTVLNVHLLSGSTAATLTSIQSAITNYLNGLQIGEEVTQSALYAAAMAVTPNLSSPIFSIKGLYLGTTALPSTTADIAIAFNAVAQGVTANCTVNSV
jgi:hypothetical protein